MRANFLDQYRKPGSFVAVTADPDEVSSGRLYSLFVAVSSIQNPESKIQNESGGEGGIGGPATKCFALVPLRGPPHLAALVEPGSHPSATGDLFVAVSSIQNPESKLQNESGGEGGIRTLVTLR